MWATKRGRSNGAGTKEGDSGQGARRVGILRDERPAPARRVPPEAAGDQRDPHVPRDEGQRSGHRRDPHGVRDAPARGRVPRRGSERQPRGERSAALRRAVLRRYGWNGRRLPRRGADLPPLRLLGLRSRLQDARRARRFRPGALFAVRRRALWHPQAGTARPVDD